MSALTANQARPAHHSNAPGSRTSPSGSIPIRPAPWTSNGHVVADQPEHGRRPHHADSPSPGCGDAIQPTTASVVIVASPASAAGSADAQPPEATEPEPTRRRLRAGLGTGLEPDPAARGSGEPDAFGGSRHKTPHLQCRHRRLVEARRIGLSRHAADS